MCIGPDAGCQVVPDPTAPIEIVFLSLDPMRIPMLSPAITINGPMLMGAIPGIFFIASLAGLFGELISLWSTVPG